MGFLVNTRVPGFEPWRSQDDLTTSQSYYHKFYVLGFFGKQHASGGFPHDSTSFIEGTVDIKGVYGLRYLFQGEVCER